MGGITYIYIDAICEYIDLFIYFFNYLYYLAGCVGTIVWTHAVVGSLICTHFIVLNVYLFSAAEHVSHGKAL